MKRHKFEIISDVVFEIIEEVMKDQDTGTEHVVKREKHPIPNMTKDQLIVQLQKKKEDFIKEVDDKLKALQDDNTTFST